MPLSFKKVQNDNQDLEWENLPGEQRGFYMKSSTGKIRVSAADT